jgi:hypothetical protein
MPAPPPKYIFKFYVRDGGLRNDSGRGSKLEWRNAPSHPTPRGCMATAELGRTDRLRLLTGCLPNNPTINQAHAAGTGTDMVRISVSPSPVRITRSRTGTALARLCRQVTACGPVSLQSADCSLTAVCLTLLTEPDQAARAGRQGRPPATSSVQTRDRSESGGIRGRDSWSWSSVTLSVSVSHSLSFSLSFFFSLFSLSVFFSLSFFSL